MVKFSFCFKSVIKWWFYDFDFSRARAIIAISLSPSLFLTTIHVVSSLCNHTSHTYIQVSTEMAPIAQPNSTYWGILFSTSFREFLSIFFLSTIRWQFSPLESGDNFLHLACHVFSTHYVAVTLDRGSVTLLVSKLISELCIDRCWQCRERERERVFLLLWLSKNEFFWALVKGRRISRWDHRVGSVLRDQTCTFKF